MALGSLARGRVDGSGFEVRAVAARCRRPLGTSAVEGSADRSAANRRNEEPPPPPPNLKWKPGTGRAAAKVRAKEMRKATEERTERREAIRHARRAHADGSAADADSAAEDAQEAESRDSVRRDGKKDMKERAYQMWYQTLSLPEAESKDSAAAKGTHAEPEPAPLAPSSVSYDKLPADLWRLVLSHADAATLAACASCAKPLGSLTATPSLWRAAHARIFGGIVSHGDGTIRPLPHCDPPHEAEAAEEAEATDAADAAEVADAADAADAAGDADVAEAAGPSGSWRSACLHIPRGASLLSLAGCVTGLKRVKTRPIGGHAPLGAVNAPLGGLGRSRALRICPRHVSHAKSSRLRRTGTSATEIILADILRLRFLEMKPLGQKASTASI